MAPPSRTRDEHQPPCDGLRNVELARVALEGRMANLERWQADQNGSLRRIANAQERGATEIAALRTYIDGQLMAALRGEIGDEQSRQQASNTRTAQVIGIGVTIALTLGVQIVNLLVVLQRGP